MENKSQVNGSSSSSLHHLFSPKDSSSLSSTSEILGSIFPPPPPVQGKDSIHSVKQWNLAISAHLSTMEAKNIILQSSKPLMLPYISGRKGKKVIPLESILMVLQGAIGGRAHCITNVSIQNNANVSTQGMVELDQPYYYGQ
ncbi:uncharacterized protein [Gossypium hirsutum]|uniref:Uncharacterized protein isoform X2 n=1 Tax=Gossypium hirsutum TaxID=3635 RepID=A0ABM2YW72_GOSHI|nr:uncharacterized protein LOC107936654 isoform X2 [Gossypium hirsutum]